MKNKKWILAYGIHRGTLMSRDCGQETCASLQECQNLAKKIETDMRSIGYQIWYAHANGPNGERETVLQGNPYSR